MRISLFREESQTTCEDIWFTSRVMRRMASNIFITKKRPYILEGRINHQRAMQNNTPQFILNAFKVCNFIKDLLIIQKIVSLLVLDNPIDFFRMAYQKDGTCIESSGKNSLETKEF